LVEFVRVSPSTGGGAYDTATAYQLALDHHCLFLMNSGHHRESTEKIKISSTSNTPVLLRARLAEIDAEMADLHARLRDLAIARKPVIDALKSTVYQALTLPPEITAEIFKECVDQVTIRDVASVPEPSFRPASALKAWRYIALTPLTIWSDIEMSRSCDSISRIEKLLLCGGFHA
jgi:hypothetical protein